MPLGLNEALEGSVFLIPSFMFFTKGRDTKKNGSAIYPGGTFKAFGLLFLKRDEGDSGARARKWYRVDFHHQIFSNA